MTIYPGGAIQYDIFQQFDRGGATGQLSGVEQHPGGFGTLETSLPAGD